MTGCRRGLGLKPQRVETYKLSTDQDFEAKLVNIVGLYLNPPEHAIVLCADESPEQGRRATSPQAKPEGHGPGGAA